MSLIQRWRLACTVLGMGAAAALGGLTGCALMKPDEPGKPAAETPGQPHGGQTQSAAESPGGKPGGHTSGQAGQQPAGRAPIKLGPPERPRDWQHARLQAAQRLVAAHPEGSYMGKPPDILLAIPVLTIELNGDGSVRNITVMRYPSQAKDTVNVAMAAIRKAAPYGDVSKLPKPWKFNETFLFNDQRKFKPMTLDR